LNSLKGAIKRSRKGLRQGGLADTRHIFDQKVPAGQEGYQRQTHNLRLAPNYAFDGALQQFDSFGGGLERV